MYKAKKGQPAAESGRLALHIEILCYSVKPPSIVTSEPVI
ncbi:hypothetical protein PALA111701_16670 [Paenibacillus lactis]